MPILTVKSSMKSRLGEDRDSLKAKELVIFNPAVGGWSSVERDQKFWKTCLRGVEKIVNLY